MLFLWYLFLCHNVASLTNFEIKVGNKPTSVSVSVHSPFLIALYSVTPLPKLYKGVLTQRKLHPNKLCLLYNDIFCYGATLRAVLASDFGHIFHKIDIWLIKTNSPANLERWQSSHWESQVNRLTGALRNSWHPNPWPRFGLMFTLIALHWSSASSGYMKSTH